MVIRTFHGFTKKTRISSNIKHQNCETCRMWPWPSREIFEQQLSMGPKRFKDMEIWTYTLQGINISPWCSAYLSRWFSELPQVGYVNFLEGRLKNDLNGHLLNDFPIDVPLFFHKTNHSSSTLSMEMSKFSQDQAHRPLGRCPEAMLFGGLVPPPCNSVQMKIPYEKCHNNGKRWLLLGKKDNPSFFLIWNLFEKRMESEWIPMNSCSMVQIEIIRTDFCLFGVDVVGFKVRDCSSFTCSCCFLF